MISELDTILRLTGIWGMLSYAKANEIKMWLNHVSLSKDKVIGLAAPAIHGPCDTWTLVFEKFGEVLEFPIRHEWPGSLIIFEVCNVCGSTCSLNLTLECGCLEEIKKMIRLDEGDLVDNQSII